MMWPCSIGRGAYEAEKLKPHLILSVFFLLFNYIYFLLICFVDLLKLRKETRCCSKSLTVEI